MAMAGYNPNMSLLPAGGGTIQAMSGGGSMNSAPMNGGYQFAPPMGYNATASVLPAVGGTIPAFSGGFYNQSMEGGDPVPVTVTTTVPPPTAPPATAPPATTATANNRSRRANKFAAIKEQFNPSAAPPKLEKQPGDKKDIDKLANPAPVTDAPVTATNKSPNSKQTDKKDLILFGTPITLENPNVRKDDTITDNQNTALKLLGLDGDGLTVKEKFEVIQALYDGKCDTDKPLIFLQNCDPIRKIVQSLALNLLEKLETTNSSKTGDKPVVEYIKTESGEMKVCLTFKPEQMGLLSKVTNSKKAKNTGATAVTAAAVTTPGATAVTAAAVTTPGATAVTAPAVTAVTAPGVTAVTAPGATAVTAPGATTPGASPPNSSIGTPTPVPTPITSTIDTLQEGGDIFTTSGIENDKVSCYCISTTQLLYSIPEIRNAIIKYTCKNTYIKTDIENVNIKNIEELLQTQYDLRKAKEPQIKLSDVIDGDVILCSLKNIFEDLNKSTGNFKDLIITKSLKSNFIDSIYVKYIMKYFIAYRNVIQEDTTQKSKTLPESLSTQQDATELIDFLLEVFKNNDNKEIKKISSIFDFNSASEYTCENGIVRIENNQALDNIINLKVPGYVTNTKNPYPDNTKYIKGEDKYIPIDKLIEWSQKAESLKHNPAERSSGVMGCGTSDTDFGNGSKRDIYIPTDDNKYLFVKTNRDIHNSGKRTKDNTIKVFVNQEIIVKNNVYHIFGSLLHLPSGPTGEGGHYIYDRFYIKDGDNPKANDNAIDLPYIIYDDKIVKYKDNSNNIENNTDLLVYRLVSKIQAIAPTPAIGPIAIAPAPIAPAPIAPAPIAPIAPAILPTDKLTNINNIIGEVNIIRNSIIELIKKLKNNSIPSSNKNALRSKITELNNKLGELEKVAVNLPQDKQNKIKEQIDAAKELLKTVNSPTSTLPSINAGVSAEAAAAAAAAVAIAESANEDSMRRADATVIPTPAGPATPATPEAVAGPATPAVVEAPSVPPAPPSVPPAPPSVPPAPPSVPAVISANLNAVAAATAAAAMRSSNNNLMATIAAAAVAVKHNNERNAKMPIVEAAGDAEAEAAGEAAGEAEGEAEREGEGEAEGEAAGDAEAEAAGEAAGEAEKNNLMKIAVAAAAAATKLKNSMNNSKGNNLRQSLSRANNELAASAAATAVEVVNSEAEKLQRANKTNKTVKEVAAAAAAVSNIQKAAEAAEILAKSQREAAEAAALVAAANAEREAAAAKAAEVERVRAAEAAAEAERVAAEKAAAEAAAAAEAEAEKERVKVAEVAAAAAVAAAAKAAEEQATAAAAAAEAQLAAEAAAQVEKAAKNEAERLAAERLAAEKLKEAEAAAAAAAEAERVAAETAATEAAAVAEQEAANAAAAAAAEAARPSAEAAAKAEQEATERARANAAAVASAAAAAERERLASEAAVAAQAEAAAAVEQENAINNASGEVRRTTNNPEVALIAARSVQNVITNISITSGQLYKSTNFRNLKLNSMMSRLIEKMKIKNLKSSTIITITPEKRQEYINNLKNVLQILTDLKKEIKNKTIPPQDKTAYEAAYQTQIEFVNGIITELNNNKLKTYTKDIDNIIALFNSKKLTNNEVTQILESLRKILDIKIEERKQQIKKGNKKSTEKIAIIERIEYILKELADNTKSKGELDIIPIKYYIIEEFIKKHITPEDAKEIAKESEVAESPVVSKEVSIKVSNKNPKLPEDIDFRTARSIDDIMYYLLSDTTSPTSKDSIITLYKIMMRKGEVPGLDEILKRIIQNYEKNNTRTVSKDIVDSIQKYIDYMKIYRELQDKPTVPAAPVAPVAPVVLQQGVRLPPVAEELPAELAYTPTTENLDRRRNQSNHIARTASQWSEAARTVEEQKQQNEINYKKSMNSAKKAATKIQALVRGQAARKKVDELKKKLKTAKEAENEAEMIVRSKETIEKQLANETKKERERLNAMRKKTKVSQPQLEKGLNKELEKLKTLTQQTKIARNNANTAKINVERAKAAVEAAITGPIANTWARKVSPIRSNTRKRPNRLTMEEIIEDRLEDNAILSRRKARSNKEIQQQEEAIRSAKEKKEQERLQEISAREKEEATRKQAEKSGRMLSEAVKGQPGFIGDTYDFGRVEVPKSKTLLEALSKIQSSKPSSTAKPSRANVDRLLTNVTSTLSTPYREPPKTNKEIKNTIKMTIKKRVNESKSLQDKLGWISTYRGTYSKNKEIIPFLDELEYNLGIPDKLNQLVKNTQDIPSVTNKEALQQHERRAIIAKTLQERHNRIGAEATSKGKKRLLGGGKQTSKKHPIRRTFRKKDRRQSKKKNVSRKKQRK